MQHRTAENPGDTVVADEAAPKTTASAQFESLKVRCAPGFPDGGFRLDALAPGVNVIFGPNGAGKTTTARTLQRLLWPDTQQQNAGELSAEAMVRIGGDRWLIDWNFGRLRFQLNGIDCGTSGPDLPNPDLCRQYQLPLHDLLTEHDHEFATKLQQMAAGGYDLPGAAQSLGFTLKPSSPRKLSKLFEEARSSVRKATLAQQELEKKQQNLDDLQRQLEEAREAAHEVAVLDAAITLRHTHTKHQEAKARLEQYPAAMAHVTGREQAELDSARGKLREHRQHLNTAQRDAEQAREQMQHADLPDGGLARPYIESIHEQARALRELQDDQQRVRQDLADAEAERAAYGSAQPLGIDPQAQAKLRDIDASAIEQFRQQAQALDVAQRRQQQIDQQLRDLDHAPDEPAPAVDEAARDRVRDGYRLLRDALEGAARDDAAAKAKLDVMTALNAQGFSGYEPGEDEREPRQSPFTPNHLLAAITLLSTLIVAALSLGRGLGYLLVAAGLMGAAILAIRWQWRTLQEEKRHAAAAANAAIPQTDHLGAHRSSYERFDLPQPESWTPDAIAHLMEQLAERLVEAQRSLERARIVSDLLRQKEAADQTARDARDGWHELLSDWQITKGPTPHEQLWLVHQMSRWAAADARCDGLTQRLTEIGRQFEAHLQTLNSQLAEHGFAAVASVETAVRTARDLEDRARDYREGQKSLQDAEHRTRQCEQAVQDCAQTVAEIFDRLELSQNDDAALAQLLTQHNHYREARSAFDEATSHLRLRQGALRELAPDGFDTLAGADEVTLAQQREDARDRAETEAQVHQQLGAVHTEIEKARQGTTLQQALANQAHAAEDLRDSRAADVGSVVGQTLIEHLQKQQRDRDQPQVLKRAQELLARITRGRYTLTFDACSATPGFVAIDCITERGHALAQLSSGTRLQLLVAVRLAFVEQQERGVKLPLFLDETLGNSDDVRAREIVDTVIEVSRMGRQIFYFTAQADEAGKWKHALTSQGSEDWQVINLLDCRDEQQGGHTSMPISPVEAQADVPDPADHDRASYAEALGVPAINPRQPAGAVHLWYVVRDLDVLHRLLQEARIETWGQLNSLVEAGGLPWVGKRDDWQSIRARAGALDAAIRGWRVGRGRMINRQVLQDSGAVTSAFIDRVSELCDEVAGDPQQVLDGLEAGKVARFQTSKREELQDYLLENQYIENAEPLTPSQIRLRVLGEMSQAMTQKTLSSAEVDELLACVTLDA